MRIKIPIGYHFAKIKMHIKNLIIIGGNSELIKEIIKMDFIYSYENVFLISHRSNKTKTKFQIIDSVEPKNILKVIESIFYENNKDFHIIISNTPPQSSDFSNEKTMEWAMTSVRIMNTLSFNKKIEKVIYAGSCLSLLPFYHNSVYKNIKCLELRSYIDLRFSKFKKNSFVILPPMESGNEKQLKLNLVKDSYSTGAKLMIKAIVQDKQIIFPSGVVGIACRLLFHLRYWSL